MLITSGIMLLKTHPQGKRVFLISIGMVVYAMINSAGYFAQSGDWVFVIMFGILLALALACIIRVLDQKAAPATG